MPYIEYDEVAGICRECGRNFRSEEDLLVHMEEVHAPSQMAPEPSPVTVRTKRGARASPSSSSSKKAS
jgi:hypothetical protein